MKPPTTEELVAKARETYEQARDEAKEVAILTIAMALLKAHGEGADIVFDAAEERIKFLKSIPITKA